MGGDSNPTPNTTTTGRARDTIAVANNMMMIFGASDNHDNEKVE